MGHHKVGWGPKPITRKSGGDGGGKAQKAEFKRGHSIDVKVAEASDVVSLGDGRYLVAGDQSNRLGLVGKDGKVSYVELEDVKDGRSGFEGLAYDARNKRLYLSREEQGEVLRFSWDPDKSAKPKLEKTIKLDLDGPKNKGLEGLAYLPGEGSPTGRPQLIAAKEGKPRELLLMGENGTEKPRKIELEDQVRDVCKDFSAVTVDPKTGHLFISSDESSTITELQLEQKGGDFIARLVQSFPVRDKDGKALDRIEGLAFDPEGNLHALTENKEKLLTLERQ